MSEAVKIFNTAFGYISRQFGNQTASSGKKRVLCLNSIPVIPISGYVI